MGGTTNVTPIFIHTIFLSAITDGNNASKATGNYAVLTNCKHFAGLDDTEWGEQEEPTMLIQFPTDLLLWGKLLLLFFSCALSLCPHSFLPTEHYRRFPRMQMDRAWSWRLPPIAVKKNKWKCTATSPFVFTAWCLRTKTNYHLH
jgi:hypothetical protein